MNLIKSQVTFSEVMSIVRDIADSCFLQDENGNDVDYMPACKQASIQVAFLENFTDFEFELAKNVNDDGETSEIFDSNYSKYMQVDIDAYIEEKREFNKSQWISILRSANELIDFRKQQLIANNSTSKYVNELLQKQIEVADLQKTVLEQQKLANEYITPEQQKAFAEKIMELDAEKMMSEIIKLVHKDSKNKPQDRKKAQSKKSKVTTLPLTDGE